MQKFVRVKKKLRKILKWKVFETVEREVISPLPSYIKEEIIDRTKARLSTPGVLGLLHIEVEKEKKTSKNEEWNQKRQARREKSNFKKDKEG